METTEKKFKDMCRKHKMYCKKIPTHTATGHGQNQEADFIAAKKRVYYVECKECKGKTFSFDRFTQLKKLMLVTKKTGAIQPFLLVHFKTDKKVVLLDITSYKIIIALSKFKNGKQRASFNVDDIDKQYVFNWSGIFEVLK